MGLFNFNENQTVSPDKADEIPEDFRGLYSEGEDGNLVLRSDDAGVSSAIKAVSSLYEALNKARSDAKNARNKQVDLSALSDYGTDVESIKAGVEAKISEIKEASKGKGDEIDRLVAKATDAAKAKHAEELAKKDMTVGKLTKALEHSQVVGAATSALSAAGAIDPDLALPHVRQHLKMHEDDDGNFGVMVVDESGDPRWNDHGGHMSIEELVKDMKKSKKYASLFRSESHSGGGARPGRVGGGSGNNNGREKSATSKIAAGLRGRR